MDWQYLITDKRAKVYLLWLVLLTGGFVLTHLHQEASINGLWVAISLLGLGYMAKVMSLGDSVRMQQIFGTWFATIALGMVISYVVFELDSRMAGQLIAHLGAFWMIIMGVGYLLNGLVDLPGKWYYIAAALNVVAGVLCFAVADLTQVQYLIAAAVSAVSMGGLWLFRSRYQ